jgi:two-component system, chemotaxis family, sensor kinase CheA
MGMGMGKDMSCNIAFTDAINNSLELMQEMKVALLRPQWSPADTTVANTIPCATQAIKGLANFHGSKYIVAFSYVFEGVLSRMRDAELRAEANLIALLLSCCDHVSQMVSQLATNKEMYLGHCKKSLGLVRQLHTHHGSAVSGLFEPSRLTSQY